MRGNPRGAARLGIRGPHHADSDATVRALGELFGDAPHAGPGAPDPA
jgi:hypothetical protein